MADFNQNFEELLEKLKYTRSRLSGSFGNVPQGEYMNDFVKAGEEALKDTDNLITFLQEAQGTDFTKRINPMDYSKYFSGASGTAADNLEIAKNKTIMAKDNLFAAADIINELKKTNTPLHSFSFDQFKDNERLRNNPLFILAKEKYAKTSGNDAQKLLDIIRQEGDISFMGSKVDHKKIYGYAGNIRQPMNIGLQKNLEDTIWDQINKKIFNEQNITSIKGVIADARSELISTLAEARDVLDMPSENTLATKSGRSGSHGERLAEFSDPNIYQEDWDKALRQSEENIYKQTQKYKELGKKGGFSEGPSILKQSIGTTVLNEVYSVQNEMERLIKLKEDKRLPIHEKAQIESKIKELQNEFNTKRDQIKKSVMEIGYTKQQADIVLKDFEIKNITEIKHRTNAMVDKINGKVIISRVDKDKGIFTTRSYNDLTNEFDRARVLNQTLRLKDIGEVEVLETRKDGTPRALVRRKSFDPLNFKFKTKEVLNSITKTKKYDQDSIRFNDFKNVRDKIIKDIKTSEGLLLSGDNGLAKLISTDSIRKNMGKWVSIKELQVDDTIATTNRIREDVLTTLYKHAGWSLFSEDKDRAISAANEAYLEATEKMKSVNIMPDSNISDDILKSFSDEFNAIFHKKYFSADETGKRFPANQLVDNLLKEYYSYREYQNMTPEFFVKQAMDAISDELDGTKLGYGAKKMSTQDIMQYINEKEYMSIEERSISLERLRELESIDENFDESYLRNTPVDGDDLKKITINDMKISDPHVKKLFKRQARMIAADEALKLFPNDVDSEAYKVAVKKKMESLDVKMKALNLMPGILGQTSMDITDETYSSLLRDNFTVDEIAKIKASPEKYLPGEQSFKDINVIKNLLRSSDKLTATMDNVDYEIKMNQKTGEVEFKPVGNRGVAEGVIGKAIDFEIPTYSNEYDYVKREVNPTMIKQVGLELYDEVSNDKVNKVYGNYMAHSNVSTIQNLRELFNTKSFVVADYETTGLIGSTPEKYFSPIELYAGEERLIDKGGKISSESISNYHAYVKPSDAIKDLIHGMDRTNLEKLGTDSPEAWVLRNYAKYEQGLNKIDEPFFKKLSDQKAIFSEVDIDKLLTSAKAGIKWIDENSLSKDLDQAILELNTFTKNKIIVGQNFADADQPFINVALKNEKERLLKRREELISIIEEPKVTSAEESIKYRSPNRRGRKKIAELSDKQMIEYNTISEKMRQRGISAGHEKRYWIKQITDKDLLEKKINEINYKRDLDLKNLRKDLEKSRRKSEDIVKNVKAAYKVTKNVDVNDHANILQNASRIVELEEVNNKLNRLGTINTNNNKLIEMMHTFGILHPNVDSRTLASQAATYGMDIESHHLAKEDVKASTDIFIKQLNEITDNDKFMSLIIEPEKYQLKIGDTIAKVAGASTEADITQGAYTFTGMSEERNKVYANLVKYGQPDITLKLEGKNITDLQFTIGRDFARISPDEMAARQDQYTWDRTRRNIQKGVDGDFKKGIDGNYDSFMRQKENALYVSGGELRAEVISGLKSTQDQYRIAEGKLQMIDVAKQTFERKQRAAILQQEIIDTKTILSTRIERSVFDKDLLNAKELVEKQVYHITETHYGKPNESMYDIDRFSKDQAQLGEYINDLRRLESIKKDEDRLIFDEKKNREKLVNKQNEFQKLKTTHIKAADVVKNLIVDMEDKDSAKSIFRKTYEDATVSLREGSGQSIEDLSRSILTEDDKMILSISNGMKKSPVNLAQEKIDRLSNDYSNDIITPEKEKIYKQSADWYNSKQANMIQGKYAKVKALQSINKYGLTNDEGKTLIKSINRSIKEKISQTRSNDWVKKVGQIATDGKNFDDLYVDTSSVTRAEKSISGILRMNNMSMDILKTSIAQQLKVKEIEAKTNSGLAEFIYQNKDKFGKAEFKDITQILPDEVIGSLSTDIDLMIDDAIKSKYKGLPEEVPTKVLNKANEIVGRMNTSGMHYFQSEIGIKDMPIEDVIFKNEQVFNLQELKTIAESYKPVSTKEVNELLKERFDIWTKDEKLRYGSQLTGFKNKYYDEAKIRIKDTLWNTDEDIRLRSMQAWGDLANVATSGINTEVTQINREAMGILNWRTRGETSQMSFDDLGKQIMTEGVYAGKEIQYIPKEELDKYVNFVEPKTKEEWASKAAEMKMEPYELERIVNEQKKIIGIGSRDEMSFRIQEYFYKLNNENKIHLPDPSLQSNPFKQVPSFIDNEISNILGDIKSTYTPTIGPRADLIRNESAIASTVIPDITASRIASTAIDTISTNVPRTRMSNKAMIGIGVSVGMATALAGGMRMSPVIPSMNDEEEKKTTKPGFDINNAAGNSKAGSKVYSDFGMQVEVTGKANSKVNIDALSQGISGSVNSNTNANVNVTTRDDRKGITGDWLEKEIIKLLTQQ